MYSGKVSLTMKFFAFCQKNNNAYKLDNTNQTIKKQQRYNNNNNNEDSSGNKRDKERKKVMMYVCSMYSMIKSKSI